MKKPRVIVLRTAGTNCDRETAFAFKSCGAHVDLVHINELSKGVKALKDYQILALPGGFTYGDDIASGKILSNEIRYRLGRAFRLFIENKKLIIGICNGFQVLVKAGILPGLGSDRIEASLSFNDSGKFEDRWTYLKVNKRSLRQKTARQVSAQAHECIWTRRLQDIIYLPVAHGEGKFIPKDKDILKSLKKNGQIVFQYVDANGKAASYPDNPNGSAEGIAGICDPTGRVLGLMPHPERHMLDTQHPRWTREGLKGTGDGMQIFKNGVEYAREHF